MNLIDTVSDRLSKGLKLIAAVWIFLLSLLILLDVLARGAFDQPILGIKELVANSIVMIAFMQLPYTVRIGGLLRAEIVDQIMTKRQRKFLLALAYILGALLFFFVTYACWNPMLRSWASGEYEGEGGFRVPTYPVRTAIVVCSMIATINFLLAAYAAIVHDRLPSGDEK